MTKNRVILGATKKEKIGCLNIEKRHNWVNMRIPVMCANYFSSSVLS